MAVDPHLRFRERIDLLTEDRRVLRLRVARLEQQRDDRDALVAELHRRLRRAEAENARLERRVASDRQFNNLAAQGSLGRMATGRPDAGVRPSDGDRRTAARLVREARAAV